MKPFLKLILVLGGLICLIIVPCIYVNQGEQPIGKNDLVGIEVAKNNLISFINSHSNDGLVVSKGEDIIIDSITPKKITQYPSKIEIEFDTNNSVYRVNGLTGQVDSALSYKSITGHTTYTLEQAEIIAKKYASQLYPGFSNRTLKLCEKSSMNGTESLIHMYSWCEYKNDVRTPNGISIWISDVSGELLSFNMYDTPLLITDYFPKISQEQAVSLIKAKYSYLSKITEISPALIVEYMDYGKQMLVWEISIKGEMGTGTWRSSIWNTEYVDALTGAVLPSPPLPIIDDI